MFVKLICANLFYKLMWKDNRKSSTEGKSKNDWHNIVRGLAQISLVVKGIK